MNANWDVDVGVKSMTIGLGVIITDAAGEVQVSLACTIKANLQPIIAEARALRRAMELCAYLGFSNVIFEGDCQEIVKAPMHNKTFGQLGVLFSMISSRSEWDGN